MRLVQITGGAAPGSKVTFINPRHVAAAHVRHQPDGRNVIIFTMSNGFQYSTGTLTRLESDALLEVVQS